jgi:hypothetical protein
MPDIKNMNITGYFITCADPEGDGLCTFQMPLGVNGKFDLSSDTRIFKRKQNAHKHMMNLHDKKRIKGLKVNTNYERKIK